MPIPVHFSSLIPKCWCHSCHLLFDHFQFTLIHGPNNPRSYATVFFIASDFTSTTSYIHNWVLFSFLFYLFLLSHVISPLMSSSILGTCQPEESQGRGSLVGCHLWGCTDLDTTQVTVSMIFLGFLTLSCFKGN